jgi:2-amino-4-hydroxy-6-hydroxymethyldihydropteridine diphosphokinase
MGKVVFLGLGSNLGDREGFLKKALELIDLEAGEVVATSPVYQTEPWGFHAKDPFLNMTAEIRTLMDPESLLLQLLNIEAKMGRKRDDNGYSSRKIDLDILLYDNMTIQRPGLTIPHPLMHERRFVLVPLCDIAQGIIHPVFKKTIAVLLDECRDRSQVRRFK